MANNYKGRTLLLEIYDSGTGTYKKLGGINTKSISRDNPVADATSASTPTTSNETEACFTGFCTLTINGSGLIDTRTNSTVYGYKPFAQIVHSSNPVANMRFTDSEETFSPTAASDKPKVLKVLVRIIDAAP